MFPITHIWFAEKVMGYRDSSVILGAIFPDIVITGALNYNQTHYCGFGLFDALKEPCPVFAQAMITHTVNPKGLDYYGDECYGSGYKGYCFQKGQHIINQVIEACNIPESLGLWKAHNFIEMGIELDIIQSHPYLAEDLHKAFLDKEAIEQAAGPIENYFNLKKYEITESFYKFSQYIEMEHSDCYTLADKYDLQMQAKHHISIDVDKAAKIIDDCRCLIKSDIKEFMEYSTHHVRRLLEGGDDFE